MTALVLPTDDESVLDHLRNQHFNSQSHTLGPDEFKDLDQCKVLLINQLLFYRVSRVGLQADTCLNSFSCLCHLFCFSWSKAIYFQNICSCAITKHLTLTFFTNLEVWCSRVNRTKPLLHRTRDSLATIRQPLIGRVSCWVIAKWKRPQSRMLQEKPCCDCFYLW